MTTSALHQQVRRTIRRHDLCPVGIRLLVGLSGGSDSVALTLLLRELAEYGGFSIVGLAHLNHGLRASAGRDQQFCRDFGQRLGLPVVIESADIRGYGATQRLSLEDAARRLRYDFLGRAAVEVGADRIAVGHTQDDQAETFLLKLMRGAGLTGLGGIYPRRDAIIRPLLDVSRAELRRFLGDRGEPWVEDESNADEEMTRNRVRHRVIPELDRTYGGKTSPGLARAASLIRDDAQWLEALAERRSRELSLPAIGGVEIDRAILAAEPQPVRRRLLLRMLRACAGAREVGLGHVEAVEEVLDGTSAGADVPGGHVELRRGKLVLMVDGTR